MTTPGAPRLPTAQTSRPDITDFFRAGGTSKATRTADVDATAPTTLAFLSEPELPVRKRSTRIPFFGRQRTKSTLSDASSSSTSPSRNSEARNSNASMLTEPRLDSDTERSQPPSPSKGPSSLGSKLAATFAPSRPKLFSASPRKPPTISNPSTESTPITIASPSPQLVLPSRRQSVDSASSQDRSVTPRPTQPTITVSVPPDSLEDYKDMFTLPSTSDTVRFPSAAASSSDSPGEVVKRRITRSTPRASRIARKPSVGRSRDGAESEDSEAVMSDTTRPSPPMLTPTAEKRRTLATTMPYKYSEKSGSKSTMKSPPSFPLPPPPSDPPSSALPLVPTRTDSLSSRRHRAQTLSTVPDSAAAAAVQQPPHSIANALRSRKSSETKRLPDVPTANDKENFDMEAASPEQLRQELQRRMVQLEEARNALLLRNQQFDELASYLLSATDSHAAEKRSLQKKIENLELEATRRDKELQGLKWLVANPQPARSLDANLTSEDSGTELTSGAEGETSGAESTSSAIGRNKTKKSYNLMASIYRSSNSSSSRYAATNATRSSTSSSTSPSSSTSSLVALSSPATTVASLGSIPETSPPPPPPPKPSLPPPTAIVRSKDPAVAAAILAAEQPRSKEERRAARAANRLSTSSVTSNASVAYSANLKRGRPPSIAQVLASSPRMESGIPTTTKPRTYASGSLSS
ncbi:hypothetical protein HMN09_00499700 [Mycena chlorophos]|uniref:Uncharacterized protein n=1 Tax=Mycena chlorophos TaxID=658473 RepID=A0A8H6T7U6_MYCCL|nr:hypothetical protein HMN09_00499700 [Mycena chlorophos]